MRPRLTTVLPLLLFAALAVLVGCAPTQPGPPVNQTTLQPPVAAPPAVPAVPAPRPRAVPATGNETVYVTDTGKNYHARGCQSLAKSAHPMPRREARARGYTACKLCGG